MRAHRAPHPDGRLWTTSGVPLRGGIVTDPDEIAAIRARIAYGDLPWWRRLFTRAPAGW